MKGPIRLPAPQDIVTMVNRAGGTIRKNCLVGYGTADFTGDRPIDSLNVAGVGKIAGAIQSAVADDESIGVYRAGDVVLESDGSGTISVGQRVIAVAGGSLAASGRVAALPGSPTGGTNYEIVGEALTAAAATAGAEVVVRLNFFTYQG